MSATKVLTNVPFIYKDGKTYRFSIVKNGYTINNINDKFHTVNVDIRYEMTIKIFKWRKTFYVWRAFCEPFGIYIDYIFDYLEIRRRVLNDIQDKFRKIEENNQPKKTQLEKVFDGFDGFIGVSDKDKAQYKRVDAINDIIK